MNDADDRYWEYAKDHVATDELLDDQCRRVAEAAAAHLAAPPGDKRETYRALVKSLHHPEGLKSRKVLP